MAYTGVAGNQVPVQACTTNGTTQATALAGANSQINLLSQAVSVNSTGAGGAVVLPFSAPGYTIDLLQITGGNTCNVFPNVGESINAIAVNSAITMAALTRATFICVTQGTWLTNPLLPS